LNLEPRAALQRRVLAVADLSNFAPRQALAALSGRLQVEVETSSANLEQRELDRQLFVEDEVKQGCLLQDLEISVRCSSCPVANVPSPAVNAVIFEPSYSVDGPLDEVAGVVPSAESLVKGAEQACLDVDWQVLIADELG
jgi:hypothetical protein